MVASERPGVRRDTRVRPLGRRGTGPRRIARARAAHCRRQGRRRRQHQQRHRRQLSRWQRQRGQPNPSACTRTGRRIPMSRSLARYIARVAALYVPSHRVRLMARPDRFAAAATTRHSATAGTRRSPSAKPTRTSQKQHSALDTVDGVDVAYLAQNARVNAVERRRARAGASGTGGDEPARSGDVIGRQPSGYDAQPAVACRRRAPRRIESTGARPGRTTGSSHVWLATRRSSLCRASPSTTTSSASLPSAPEATKAWSAPTSSDVRNGDL